MDWTWPPKGQQDPYGAYADRNAAVGNAATNGLAPGSEDDFGGDKEGFAAEDYGVDPNAQKDKGGWVEMLKGIFGGQK